MQFIRKLSEGEEPSVAGKVASGATGPAQASRDGMAEAWVDQYSNSTTTTKDASEAASKPEQQKDQLGDKWAKEFMSATDPGVNYAYCRQCITLL